ncbi:small multi-drug export protein [Treponema sp. TIM-1]|uniref:COG2426 family protein n=1 Tax=Treponema sp. TIM-1 TaxID=2898417 RepID=UPI003980C42C
MNTLTILGWTAFLSFLPISELRGGIPFAVARGIPWYWAYPFAVGINILVAPACWIFLSTLHKVFLKMAWYRGLFGRFVERTRVKLKTGVEKWGWLGVAAFVAVPLPVTGAWTGTLGAWVLGMGKGRTIAAVTLGVLTAGVIVTAVVLLGIRGLHFFIKKI